MAWDEAFKVPFQYIDWARQAVSEMEAEWVEFKSSSHTVTVSENDPETGRYFHKIRLKTPLPTASLARKANEGITRARDAFDNALYAACTTIQKTPTAKQLNFPWSECPTDLENNRLKGRDRKGNLKIPPEFHDVIRRQEPYFTGDSYSGGDDHIRELAKISNDRHSVGIATMGRVSGTYISEMLINIGAPHFRHPPVWDPVNNEVVFAETIFPAHVDPNCKVALQIVLDVTSDLRNVPADVAIKAFADKAEAFTKAIRRQCKRELFYKPAG